MQTEEIKSNGGAVIVAASENAYPFDAATIKVEVSLGKGMVLTHELRKPDLEHYLTREKAIKRVSRIGSNQEITGENNEVEANAEFYDLLIVEAAARKTGQADTAREFGEDECRRFTVEAKNSAVAKMSTSFFEVEGDDDPLAALFESQGSLTVRQEIGEEGNPSYVIRYQVKAPSPSQRSEFLKGSFQLKRKVEKRNRQTIETVFNLNKGVKLFGALIQGVTGGRIECGEFSTETKEDFLKMIDPMFMNGVVDAAVGYFDQSSD